MPEDTIKARAKLKQGSFATRTVDPHRLDESPGNSSGMAYPASITPFLEKSGRSQKNI
jgi:hypothetical protein